MRNLTQERLVLAFLLLALLAGNATKANANDKLYTRASFGENGGNLGAEVEFFGRIYKPVQGNSYTLRYQIRVHETPGVSGKLLGDQSNPGGVAYNVVTSNKPHDNGSIYLRGRVDVTRDKIRRMTNLPKKSQWNKVVLRVEPQIFHQESKEFLTDFRTEAAILIATISPNGNVTALQNLNDFIRQYRDYSFDEVKKAMNIVNKLDKYDPVFNEVPEAFAELLENKHSSDKIKTLIIDTMDPEWLDTKSNLGWIVDQLKENGGSEIEKAIERMESRADQ